MSEMEKNKIKYIQCQKGGFHYGQVLNMVCLNPECSKQLISCCACIEQQHKNHKTKPLKMIIREAEQNVMKMIPMKLNIDVIIDILQANQKCTLEKFYKAKKHLEESLSKIQTVLTNYYSSITEDIKLKVSDPKAQFYQAYKVLNETSDPTYFKQSVKKLVTMVPTQEDQQVADLSESELIDALNVSNEEVSASVGGSFDQIIKKIDTYSETLLKQINLKNIWSKIIYKFSPTLKHNDVMLVNPEVVKSVNSSGYKFAIMEPSLQKGAKTKTFSFKIKECSSNWVAIGMCHQKIVTSKAYAFNFSSLGHGGYLISANGGSWSNTKVEANNSVKAFKFTKNDVITCVVNLETNKMLFKKKENQTYQLTFEKIPGDQLHPCALFYYVNDEVEILKNNKE